jgi:tetratricopeptide (TPR) repeat protein
LFANQRLRRGASENCAQFWFEQRGYLMSGCSFSGKGLTQAADQTLRLVFATATLVVILVAVQQVRAQVSNVRLNEARDYAMRGISLAKAGKLPQAEQELREAVRLAPEVAPYRAQFASILGLQGKWQEALESFQKAIDLAPENLDFRREAAAVQWQLGLMPAAEKNLHYVLTKHPDDSGAILLLGLVKERTGDYAKAAQLLDSQFELVISQPDRTVALFQSVVQSGQHEKMAKLVDVLKLHADDQPWMDAIGRCTQIAAVGGDLQTAEGLFALIPDGNSARTSAGLHLAKLLYDRAQVSKAKELLLQLAGQGVVSADVQALLGNCLEAERQPALALQAYQRAIQADPSRIDYYEDLISLLLYVHKTNDAIAVVNQALAVAPNDARPWVWKGNVDLRRNASQDAMESYRHAAKLDNLNPDAVLGVATVYFVKGQSDEAIAEYKAGVARFPNDARFYVACAEMLLSSPDSAKLQAEAESLLQKAVKLGPQSPEAHYLLGQLAQQQGRLKDAEAEYLHSLQSDPDRSKTHFALSVVYRRMGRTDDASKEFALYQDLKQAEESGTTTAMTPVEKP